MELTTKISKTKKYTPQQDFFKYVNKEWLLNNPIPDTESWWGSFNEIRDKTIKDLKAICVAAQKEAKPKKGSNTQIIKDFYTSGTDMKKRNADEVKPLLPILKKIDNIKTVNDLVKVVAQLNKFGLHPLFPPSFDKDVKNPDMTMLYFSQGGLNLPDRDYYLDETDEMKKIRAAYIKYLAVLLELIGTSKKEAKDFSVKVLGVETTIAKANRPKELVREIDKNYEKYPVKKAEKEFLLFANGYLNELGGTHLKEIIIQQPEVLKAIDDLIKTNLEEVKVYLKATVLNSSAQMLSKKFHDAKFNFYGKLLMGQNKPRPIWKQVIQLMQGSYGTPITEALGPLYVEKHFPHQAKELLYNMIEEIKEAFKNRVKDLNWMDEKTKKLVFKKVDNISFKLGYPDKWEDISKIGIDDGPFVLNYFKMQEYDFNKKIKEAGGPANWDEWVMKPTIVNACADQMREMTFPAAFFQGAMFNPKGDIATNYGSAGSVMGHELSHFVDDQGCKYDATGKLNDWWPEDVKKAYKKGSTAFVKHYNKFSVDGIPTNGEFTQGENIGDVAGLLMAYDALQNYLKKTGDYKIINGLTPEQRFFIGFARSECEHMRPEFRKTLAKSDPHAPGEVRVMAGLSIIPAFQKAFNIKKGDPMYINPKNFPKLW